MGDNSVWNRGRLSVPGPGALGSSEKSSEVGSMSISEALSRLNRVIGIPSICARTHTQRKSIIQTTNVHDPTDLVLPFD